MSDTIKPNKVSATPQAEYFDQAESFFPGEVSSELDPALRRAIAAAVAKGMTATEEEATEQALALFMPAEANATSRGAVSGRKSLVKRNRGCQKRNRVVN